MAQENLIQRGDLLQRLTRGLEIKGVKSPALVLEPSVVPIVVLEDLAKGAFEDPKAPGWFFSERPSSGAGFLAGFAVVNSSEAVCIVDRICVIMAVALDFNVFTTTAAGAGALTTILPCSWADTRRAGVPPIGGLIGSTAAGVSPIENVLAKLRWNGGASPTEAVRETPILLGPGKALVVELTAAAGSFQCQMSGRLVVEA